MKVYIDEYGNINNESPEEIDAWLKTHDEMIAKGLSEAEATSAANRVQESMADACRNAYIITEK